MVDVVGAVLGWLVSEAGRAGLSILGKSTRTILAQTCEAAFREAATELVPEAEATWLADALAEVAQTRQLTIDTAVEDLGFRAAIDNWVTTLAEPNPVTDDASILERLDLDGERVSDVLCAALDRQLAAAYLTYAGSKPELVNLIDVVWRRNDAARLTEQNRTLEALRHEVAELASAPVDGFTIDMPLVRDTEPLALGVHRAITSDFEEPPSPRPLYVMRSADHRLRRLISGVDSRRMCLLVGESSTGKTRGAWEAIRDRVPEWTLVRPDSARDLNRLTEANAVPPESVVWLDEAQDFLSGPDAAESAQSLLRLLNEGPQPLLLIATIWPTYLPDPHADDRGSRLVRQLLNDHCEQIDWPDSFASVVVESDEVSDLIARDPRLRTAFATAGESAKVTQVLSGGTQAVRQYRDGDSDAANMVRAAVLMRKLGHHGPLPMSLLRAGFAALVDAADTDERADAALASACRPIHGVAALTEVVEDGQFRYRVHDYVYQQLPPNGVFFSVPAGLWDALMAHTDDVDTRASIASAAKVRHLLEIAYQLARPAAERGHRQATSIVAEILLGQDLQKTARQVLRSSAAAGNQDAMWKLANLLQSINETASRHWLARAARAGHKRAMLAYSTMLASEGHTEHAMWFQRKVAESDPHHAFVLGNQLLGDTSLGLRVPGMVSYAPTDDENVTEGIDWIRVAAEAGHKLARRDLGDVLRWAGRNEEASEWERREAPRIAHDIADWYTRTGRPEEAEQLLARASRAGVTFYQWDLGPLIESLGDDPDGEDILTELADKGSVDAAEALANRLSRQGRDTEAEQVLRAAAEDSVHGLEALGTWLRHQGRGGEVEADLRRQMHHSPHAASALIDLLHADDRAADLEAAVLTQAELWPRATWTMKSRLEEWGLEHLVEVALRRSAATGDPEAAMTLSDWLAKDGRPEESDGWLRQAAEKDHWPSPREYGVRLIHTGDAPAGERWLRRAVLSGDDRALRLLADVVPDPSTLATWGLRPDGTTATPWRPTTETESTDATA
ncbi:tetratricopeptide repeat protein [Stackebrandtia nassauensis]|uniref:Sel1 domain protein repeat-containing protein n=1 Tax=Stackebrandtia nassauensis (strain DSM 44728 / CIP 108903 / NRRL B-16338 / NBRC 102104 / LLR-40K-21) TaxID=446470 RepID=D3PXN4_STANL|nr:hypothetical protein [Stackebrandtia nassauensis]ADD43364.1 hypothetical protein Snas_3707 [Stackebrandtia nassauensis DSM 44728]